MKNKKQKEIDILEKEELNKDEENNPKVKRRESVEKRKKAKEMDRAARWSGFVLLLVIMFVGFLLWVSGEMRKTPTTPDIYPEYTGNYRDL